MDQQRLKAEVDANYTVFADALAFLVKERSGQFALMRDRRIEDFFPSEAEALRVAKIRFPDGLFSLQEVTNRPVDLGFFSHAIDTRIA